MAGRSAPYAVFLTLPAFAAVVTVAYRRRRRMLFGEHLVFGLHPMRPGSSLASSAGPAMTVVMFVYGVAALHTTCAGRWTGAAARAMSISLVYGAPLFAVSAAVALALFLQ